MSQDQDPCVRYDVVKNKIEAAMFALAPAPPARELQACTSAARDFMAVKDSSRVLCLALVHKRETTINSKKKMDDHYLVLRNLGYREHRLNEEVRVCLDYKCGGLDKIAADEGVNTIDCLGGEFATYEKHKQNLSMLQSEIEGRRKLNNEQEALQQKKRRLEVEIGTRGIFLRELPVHIQTIKHSSQPLLQFMSFQTKRHASSTTAWATVPQPLLLIYAQFNELIAAGVLGRSTKLTMHEKDPPAESNYGGLTITRCGVSVRLVVNETEVVFRTLPCIGNVVVVEPSDMTLVALFPGDNGEELCSLSARHTLAADATKDSSFPVTQLGRPFKWAQWLGGLISGPQKYGRLEPSSRLIAQRLKNRLASRSVLSNQLNLFAGQPSPKPVYCVGSPAERFMRLGGRFPGICTWAIYNPKRNPFMTTTKLPGDSAMPQTHYRFTMQTGRNETVVVMELSPEYPFRTPRFVLQPRDGEAGVYNPILKDVESKLNTTYDNFVQCRDDTSNSILVNQLCHLQRRLEQSPRGLMRSSRGRDRHHIAVR